jgi:5-methyltetrahydropteroyltriglutamate--homocysteine methyltransferase
MAVGHSPPFRAEVIGSLLRPRALKDAGTALRGGRLASAEYEVQLDGHIAEAIRRQEDIGLKVVTDGEFGRSSWFGFFFEGIDGFRLAPSHFKFKDADGRPSNGRPAWRRGASAAARRSRSKSSGAPAGMRAPRW